MIAPRGRIRKPVPRSPEKASATRIRSRSGKKCAQLPPRGIRRPGNRTSPENSHRRRGPRAGKSVPGRVVLRLRVWLNYLEFPILNSPGRFRWTEKRPRPGVPSPDWPFHIRKCSGGIKRRLAGVSAAGVSNALAWYRRGFRDQHRSQSDRRIQRTSYHATRKSHAQSQCSCSPFLFGWQCRRPCLYDVVNREFLAA
jgi:hypothetical protein